MTNVSTIDEQTLRLLRRTTITFNASYLQDCAMCNAPFWQTQHGSRQKFCSERCASRYWKWLRRFRKQLYDEAEFPLPKGWD